MIATCVQSLPRVLVVQTVQRAQVSQSGHSVTVTPAQIRAEVQARQTIARVQVGGQKGDKGDSGDAGSGGLLTYPAGETIHGRRAARVAAGLLFHPDTAQNAHATQVIGIATQSGSIGADVVVRTAGVVTEASWGWSPGAVWCGADGVLTQSPSSGWLLQIGRAVDATTIDVDVDTPFFRS